MAARSRLHRYVAYYYSPGSLKLLSTSQDDDQHPGFCIATTRCLASPFPFYSHCDNRRLCTLHHGRFVSFKPFHPVLDL